MPTRSPGNPPTAMHYAIVCAPVLFACGGCAGVDPEDVLPRDAAGPTLLQLDWLAGSWTALDEGTDLEEHWTQPRGGTMLGVNRSIRDGVTRAFEFLRIVSRDDGVFYVASPNGRAPTEFRLVDSAPGRAHFANPGHDFPQTIEYRGDGDTMVTTITGAIDGQPAEKVWRYKRRRLRRDT